MQVAKRFLQALLSGQLKCIDHDRKLPTKKEKNQSDYIDNFRLKWKSQYDNRDQPSYDYKPRYKSCFETAEGEDARLSNFQPFLKFCIAVHNSTDNPRIVFVKEWKSQMFRTGKIPTAPLNNT
uniref:Uncharacterized protein n=1 Tax=Candidatus Methanogaster sp. ANME-2c ERB4 TaxID=2759911 RepID=A0A7G9YMY4_9EURY|nr:hypothetical protein ICHGDBFH_00023 [Methanosarcinales archaeon ANME-2c ERB4]